ncbi:hypothetical protein S83_067280 [Arachis hypogaea]
MFVLMNKERTYSISSCTLLGSLLPVSDWRIFSPGPVEGSYLMQFQRDSQSSTATTLRCCFALHSLKLDCKTKRMFEEKECYRL